MWEIFRDAKEGGGGLTWRRHGDITCVKKKKKKKIVNSPMTYGLTMSA